MLRQAQHKNNFSRNPDKMQMKEIQTRKEIAETYLVLRQIYENLNQETYVEDVLNQMQRGYKMAAVFEDQAVENGRCIGIIGIRIIRKLQHGKAIEVEDFMIDRTKRGIGVGKMLIRWIEWQATVFGCKNIIGSLETKRQESQKIFSREKFLLEGLFFKKACE
jgi:GNAT superfamily N-acetyltransferase